MQLTLHAHDKAIHAVHVAVQKDTLVITLISKVKLGALSMLFRWEKLNLKTDLHQMWNVESTSNSLMKNICEK